MRLINITIFLFLFPLYTVHSEENTVPQTNLSIATSDPAMENNTQNEQESSNSSSESKKTFWEKFRLFRNTEDPIEASKIFIDIVTNESENVRRKFIERNYFRIADILIKLKEKNSESYAQMVAALENNGIGITREMPVNQNQSRMPPKPIENNPINKIVEIKTESARGNVNEAEKKMEILSSEHSNSAPVQTAVAEFFSEVKNFQKAEDYSSKALNIDSENPDAYKIRAVSRYSMNDVKGAIEDIKKATEIEPQDETNRLLTALIESKKNISVKSLNSLKALKDAMAEIKDEKNVYLSNNTSAKEQGFLPGNIQGSDFSRSKLYLKMAAAKNQMQDYEGALKYSNLAIEKNPDNIEAYIERANSNNFLGNYDEAIKDLSRVIQIQPNNAIALNMRAWALYKKGAVQEASSDATSALKLKPDYADAMFSRSLAYEKQGKYDEMLADLQRASLINPAYKSRFQDAVAQYVMKAPNFAANYKSQGIKILQKNNELEKNEKKPNNLGRFLTILIFTVTGGLLIALGLLHIFSGQTKETQSKITHPDILSPSIFYEGVATGKYKIISKIGQGGMGIVYKAIDQTLNREVAIKKMNEEIKVNDREKQRFIEEARLVAMLHHPNIIEIYTIFEEGEDIYLVFEYIDGETLDKKLAREIRMPFYEVKEIVQDISKALSYAHKKNIIHRDMKLSNVMISREGFIKVMDFGLARIAREALSRISTTEIVGSPAYMAPEQDRGVFLKESDIYSLGICIYEMLTGDLPFNGPDYHYQKENRAYSPISASVPGLDKNFDILMDKLLAPDPNDRYHSIEDFLSDFLKMQ